LAASASDLVGTFSAFALAATAPGLVRATFALASAGLLSALVRRYSACEYGKPLFRSCSNASSACEYDKPVLRTCSNAFVLSASAPGLVRATFASSEIASAFSETLSAALVAGTARASEATASSAGGKEEPQEGEKADDAREIFSEIDDGRDTGSCGGEDGGTESGLAAGSSCLASDVALGTTSKSSVPDSASGFVSTNLFSNAVSRAFAVVSRCSTAASRSAW